MHYTDTVDSIGYPEDQDQTLYEGPTSRRAHCPPQLTPTSKERGLKGLGDRLRREAMLRSQMAVAAAADPGHGPNPPRPYLVSKTLQGLKPPIGPGEEIDVEYGTDDICGPGQAGTEPMTPEWRVEGAQAEHSRAAHCRGMQADPLVNVVPAPSSPLSSSGVDSAL